MVLCFLSEVFIGQKSSDSHLWTLSSSGNFTPSPSSFCKMLINCFSPSSVFSSSYHFPSRTIWKNHSPPHYKALCWEVAHKCVNTNDMIQCRRKGWCLLPHACHLCLREGELVNHIFIHCPYVSKVRWFFISIFGVSLALPLEITNLLKLWYGASFKKKRQDIMEISSIYHHMFNMRGKKFEDLL